MWNKKIRRKKNMKRMSKILALILAMCMVLSMGAFASGEASGEAAGGKSVEEAYVEYIHEFLLAELEVNSSMTIDQIEDEFMPLIEAGNYTEFPADMLYSGMLNSGVAMSFDEFAAQYVPEGGETVSAEEAYVEYIHEFLLAELEVNSSMTIDQVEDEFMPLIEAGDYTSFPADMLYSGMLNSGAAMSFEEFAAQYVPAAAGGDTSEAAYQEYLKDFVASCEDIQSSGAADEFIALIDAGNYTDFPVEMLFDATWFGEVALTYDQFVAAGGDVAVADHPSNGAMLDGTG
jgi:hypothetical protein